MRERGRVGERGVQACLLKPSILNPEQSSTTGGGAAISPGNAGGGGGGGGDVEYKLMPGLQIYPVR